MCDLKARSEIPGVLTFTRKRLCEKYQSVQILASRSPLFAMRLISAHILHEFDPDPAAAARFDEDGRPRARAVILNSFVFDYRACELEGPTMIRNASFA